MTLPPGEGGSLVPIYLIKFWDFQETLLLLLLLGTKQAIKYGVIRGGQWGLELSCSFLLLLRL